MPKEFNLADYVNDDRPMSWSSISSFKWQPSGWYAKYIIHCKCKRASDDGSIPALCVVVGFADPECPVIKTSPELRFGSWVDKKIQYDKTFLPMLPRLPIEQHKMRTSFNGIPLVGYSDQYEPLWQKYLLRDSKTGRKPWDQKRADETGQLTMYAFMLYLEHKLKPEWGEFFIDWMPTHFVDGEIDFITEGEIITFKTFRTMQQVLEFGQLIKDTYAAMEDYGRRQLARSVKVDKPISRFLQ